MEALKLINRVCYLMEYFTNVLHGHMMTDPDTGEVVEIAGLCKEVNADIFHYYNQLSFLDIIENVNLLNLNFQYLQDIHSSTKDELALTYSYHIRFWHLHTKTLLEVLGKFTENVFRYYDYKYDRNKKIFIYNKINKRESNTFKLNKKFKLQYPQIAQDWEDLTEIAGHTNKLKNKIRNVIAHQGKYMDNTILYSKIFDFKETWV